MNDKETSAKIITIHTKPLWWILVGELFLLLLPPSLRGLTNGIDLLPDPVGFILIFVGLWQMKALFTVRPELKRAALYAIAGIFVSCLTVWVFQTDVTALQWALAIGEVGSFSLSCLVAYNVLCGLRRIAYGCGNETLHKHLMSRWSIIFRLRVFGYIGLMFFSGINLLLLIVVELVRAGGEVLTMAAVFRAMVELEGAAYDDARFDELKHQQEQEARAELEAAAKEPEPRRKKSLWEEEHDDPDEDEDFADPDDIVTDEGAPGNAPEGLE